MRKQRTEITLRTTQRGASNLYGDKIQTSAGFKSKLLERARDLFLSANLSEYFTFRALGFLGPLIRNDNPCRREICFTLYATPYKMAVPTAGLEEIMKRTFSVLLIAIAMNLAYSATAGAIAFSTFVDGTGADSINSTLSNHATIGFAYAGNKFVGSVYFGANNNQLYQTDLSGNNVAPFGTPIPGAGGEIYVTSSLGLGGFGLRDVFASQGNGVYRFNNDGTGGANFLGGLVGNVRGIAFDPYGAYNNDMLVTTDAGRVYRVNSSGVASQIANLGVDTEGLDFAPQQFGNVLAHTLVVASEGNGHLSAISSTGVVFDLGVVIPGAVEMLSFVPLTLGNSGNPLEGFYAASYPNNIVHAGASEFTPYLGDAIVTTESAQRVIHVHWNGSSFVATDIGAFPGQPEDGVFVTADILDPGCGVTNTCGQAPEPAGFALLALGLGLLAAFRRRKYAESR